MADQKKKGGRIAKNIAILLFVGLAALFALRQLQKRQNILRENQAIEHFNNQNYDKAVKIYKQLLPRVNAEGKERIRKQVALCYKSKGDDPGLSLNRQIELYSEALNYDKNSITDPQLLKLIKRKQ